MAGIYPVGSTACTHEPGRGSGAELRKALARTNGLWDAWCGLEPFYCQHCEQHDCNQGCNSGSSPCRTLQMRADQAGHLALGSMPIDKLRYLARGTPTNARALLAALGLCAPCSCVSDWASFYLSLPRCLPLHPRRGAPCLAPGPFFTATIPNV